MRQKGPQALSQGHKTEVSAAKTTTCHTKRQEETHGPMCTFLGSNLRSLSTNLETPHETEVAEVNISWVNASPGLCRQPDDPIQDGQVKQSQLACQVVCRSKPSRNAKP